MSQSKVTVENTTEHPFDFALNGVGIGYGYVRIPRATMEQSGPNQTAKMKNGSGEVPEILLARLIRDPIVRSWFDSRQCILVGATLEGLLAIDLPAEPKAAGQATSAEEKRLSDEVRRLTARNAELEAAESKGKKSEDKKPEGK